MTAIACPEFRAMRPSDYDAVRDLWLVSDGVRISPGDSAEGVGRCLERNPGLCLVATRGGAIVAAVMCGHDGRRGSIYHLAVAAGERRQGLATELVRRCLVGLRAEGIRRCQIFVVPENEAARKFWEVAGGRLRSDLVMLSIDL